MRDFKIYVSVATALLLVYVVAQYNRPNPVNWKPTLYYADRIPFGTYVFYHQLHDFFPNAKVTNTNQSIYNLFSKKLAPGNYIIVANEVKLNKIDLEQLVKYIKDGNTVFITAFNWGGVLRDSLKLQTKIEEQKDQTQQNFTNNTLKQATNYKFDKNISNQYFSRFDTARATVISKNNGVKATCISYKFGKGTLLLCANPGLFSNYSLLKPQGAKFAERILSYMPAKQNIYWDEYQNHDIESNNSPMQVFLNNRALQWGYYLSLFTLFIYVLFEVKRRQRVIPVIEPLKNSTVDFVNVVSSVYYKKRDNANIAYKIIVYLLSYLRENYRLKTNKLDAEFVTNLANKTGIEQAFARDLVDHINYLSHKQKVTDHELIILNQMIEKFYDRSL
jgi:hypothetical protein